MSRESIVERIISDAEREAAEIVAQAEERARECLKKAEDAAKLRSDGERAQTELKVQAILGGSAATARLDCRKAELSERRRVLDEIYAAALKELKGLDKKSALALAEKLITEYAETGDKIIFARDYKYAEDVLALEVVKSKKIAAVADKSAAKIEGGFILFGKDSDKDLSYAALLAVDREERQAEIALQIFKD